MEDSLKRLQQFKRQSNRSLANMTNQSNTVSDDDKIRLQLYLDVVEFGRLLVEKFDGYRGETNYDALYRLVEDLNKDSSSQDAPKTSSLDSNQTNGATTGVVGNSNVEFTVDEENETQIV
jgi:hypothetical protein